jgi:hypothetical protein
MNCIRFAPIRRDATRRNPVHLASFTALVALVAAAALLLPGCGGGSPAETETAPVAAQHAPKAASAEPNDRGARTRPGLYLTTEQAQALALQLHDRLVTVSASCCGPETADLDALVAFGMQAAFDLPNDTPFVVSGSDPRQAAALVNRLAELGAKQVYLVTR